MTPTETTTNHAPRAQAEESFLAGGGVMGAMMRAHDWASSPLGPVRDWPPSLRTVVSLALNSQFPTIIFWGPDLVMLYNDAYLPIADDKHPVALGRPARDFWAEVWSIAGPMLHGVLETGEATWSTDLFLPIIHNGAVGEHYFTFSYSPIRDETGAVRGVLCPVTETTERVQQERREQRLRAEAEQARDDVTRIVESMGDRFLAFDPQWRITYANANAAEFMRHRREDLLGKNYWEEFPPVLGTNIETAFRRAMAERVTVEFETYYAPWARWVEAHVSPLREGGIAVFFRDITERKQAEETLRESEERLRLATDSAEVGIWYYYIQADRLLWSPQFKRLFGLPPDDTELTYEKFLTYVHSEDRLRMGQLRHVLPEGNDFEVEYRVVWPDESVHWITAKGQVFRDGSGEIGYRGMALDITARKQAEENLQASEHRYRTLAEALPGLVWMAQPDGFLDYYNQRWYDYTDLSAEQLAGWGWQAVWHPEDLPDIRARWLESLRTGEPYECQARLQRTDGSFRWQLIRAVPLRDQAGRVLRWLGTNTDIEEQKRTEVALRESEERLQSVLAEVQQEREKLQIILGHITDEIWFCDAAGAITLLNAPPAGRERLPWETYTRQRFGDRWDELEIFTPDGRRRPRKETPLLRAWQAGESVRDVEEIIRHPQTGELLYRLVSATPLRDAAGQFIGAVTTVHDFTERRRHEDAQARLLAELQRINAEFQQFAYIVSHDLNEPLRTMRNFVQLLAQRVQGQLDGDAEELMAFVTDAAQRMQQMLTDLLAYTKAGQAPELQAVDCEDVLTHVLSALHARITECGAVITHDPLPTVHGDATRLTQVLQNLIGNALKFHDDTPPRIHISASKEDHHWKFSVRDNGIGIDPQQAGKLFQVFQRAHGKEYTGTGIGLAICKKIIEQHGGRIWVESKPHEGSMFNFTISDGGGNRVLIRSRTHDRSPPR